MAAPFIEITAYAIKEGKLEDLRKFLPELFRALEMYEPRVLAINAYVNADGTELAIVQVHPDAASMEHHAHVVHTQGRSLTEFVHATTSVQIYGTPSDRIQARARQHAASGAALSIKAEHVGGFTRLATAG
jgi:hypothetical protein